MLFSGARLKDIRIWMDVPSIIWFMYTEFHICQLISLASVEIAIMSANYDSGGMYD